MYTYSQIIENIQHLSYDEIKDLHFLTEKYLVELERERIYNEHIQSLKEFKKGKLIFSSNIKTLKKHLSK